MLGFVIVQGVIKSGDAYGNKIYNDYSGAAMTAMPQLSDDDLNNILAYTAAEKAVPVVPTAGAESTTAVSSGRRDFKRTYFRGFSNSIYIVSCWFIRSKQNITSFCFGAKYGVARSYGKNTNMEGFY